MAVTEWRGRTNSTPRMPLLKKLFWLYFMLLFFEGALRKWVMPQLSAPLLLVRDPVALLIIWEAYRTHKWPRQWSAVCGILAAALIALCFIQMIAGDNPGLLHCMDCVPSCSLFQSRSSWETTSTGRIFASLASACSGCSCR